MRSQSSLTWGRTRIPGDLDCSCGHALIVAARATNPNTIDFDRFAVSIDLTKLLTLDPISAVAERTKLHLEALVVRWAYRVSRTVFWCSWGHPRSARDKNGGALRKKPVTWGNRRPRRRRCDNRDKRNSRTSGIPPSFSAVHCAPPAISYTEHCHCTSKRASG